jgi:cell division septum initiation protein DivIVA
MVSHKEMRNWLRAEAKKADTYREIEKYLGESGDLKKGVDSLKKQYDKEAARLAGVKAESADMMDQSVQFVDAAKAEAKRIIADAREIRKQAEIFAASKNEVVDLAKQDAAKIRDLARDDADKVMRGKKGVLADIKAEIEDAEKQRDWVLSEIELAERRREAVLADIEALRKKLG